MVSRVALVVPAVVAWVSAMTVVATVVVMVLRGRDSRNIRVMGWIVAAIRDVECRRGSTSC